MMAWKIEDAQGNATTIDSLLAQYPDLYAADESGFEVDPADLRDDPETVADGGYGARDTRRILFWEDEESSENDAGGNAVADATWEE